jgi:hypothetical protein
MIINGSRVRVARLGVLVVVCAARRDSIAARAVRAEASVSPALWTTVWRQKLFKLLTAESRSSGTRIFRAVVSASEGSTKTIEVVVAAVGVLRQ